MNTAPQMIPFWTNTQRLHAWCILVLTVVFWLVPMMICSLDGRFWIPVPRRWSFQTRIAGLFSLRADEWHVSHIQVRVVAGATWQDLRVEDFSPMGVFGYRQKLDTVQEPLGNRNRDKLFENLASWVAAQWQQLYPEHTPVVEVRFLVSTWSASRDDALKLPAGAWVRPPVEGIPSTRIKILSTYRVGGPPGHKAFKVPNEPIQVLAKNNSADGKPTLTPPPGVLTSTSHATPGNAQNKQRGQLVQTPSGMPDPMLYKQRPTARGKPGRQPGGPPRVPPAGATRVPGTKTAPPPVQGQAPQLSQKGSSSSNTMVEPVKPEVDPLLKYFGPRPRDGSLSNPPFIPAALPGLSTPLLPARPRPVAPAKSGPATKASTNSQPPASLPKSAPSKTEAPKSSQP